MFAPFILICLAVATLASPQARAPKCNGFSEFCDRKYSEVSLIGANNSPLEGTDFDGKFYQLLTVPEQLRLGARFLSAEVYNSNAEISVCHKYCTEGDQTVPKCKRSLKSFLGDVAAFLKRNPEEVVTLRLINADQRPIKELDNAFATSQLKDLAFSPGAGPLPVPLDTWPTYGDLISNKKRLIIFLDSGAAPTEYPYILPQNDYFFETARNEFKKCDAVPSNANTQNKMYTLNHYNEFPPRSGGPCRVSETNALLLRATNSADGVRNLLVGIMQHANTCKGKFKKYPSVVWLNSINQPALLKLNDAFVAQRELNGLPHGILGV
jgi:hypothetical protein